jgi:hypothetical protein
MHPRYSESGQTPRLCSMCRVAQKAGAVILRPGLAFAQGNPRPVAILGQEDDTGRFKGRADGVNRRRPQVFAPLKAGYRVR